MLKVLVTGSRGWNDYELIEDALRSVLPQGAETQPVLVIHGDAGGADRMAALSARKLGYFVMAYPANWKLYGKAAGPIRNAQMLKEQKPDVVLAFWDGQSRGTAHMMGLADEAGVIVRVFEQEKAA